MPQPPDHILHRNVPLDSAKPLNPRQELFAQGMARGLTYADAYRQAGYRRVTNTYRMHRFPNVQARIKELMAETVERHRLSVDDITSELLDIVARAKSGGDSAQMLQTARAALMNLAKLHGLEDEPSGPICTCGGPGRITKVRWVIVHSDGREEDI